MLAIIGSIITVIVLAVIGFKAVPIVLDQLKLIDSLSAINRIMIFFNLVAALVLLWIGLPAFTGAIKFMLQGHSFSRFGFIGTTIFYTLSIGLWIVVNSAELYPMAIKSNREALQAMLGQYKASPKDDKDEDVVARKLKASIRKSGKFSLKDCNVVCAVGFVTDGAIAYFNTPVLRAGGSWDKVTRLGDISQLNMSQVMVLALLIGGMTLNAVMFDKFSRANLLLDKKAPSSPPPPPRAPSPTPAPSPISAPIRP
jgi:hypothetical protein